MMLFILGLFIVKGPMKWALLAATVLSILLSWGKNFMGFTDFFLDYIPMYDKFRAVSSILVIAEFTIPLLAIMALKEIVTRPQLLKENIKYVYISFGLTGGIALLFAVLPKLFFPSYISSMEMPGLAKRYPGRPVGADRCQSGRDAHSSFHIRRMAQLLHHPHRYGAFAHLQHG